LMHVTPYRAPPARPAQMHGVMDTAPAHLTPVAIADRAHFATTVADNNGTVWRMFLVTHLPPLLVEVHLIVQPFEWFVQK